MKKAWDIIKTIVVVLVAVMAVCIMIFTLISVRTFNQSERSLLGYKVFIVMSDSMSATDFCAGDLILVKEVDPAELKAGDVISFSSRNDGTYGETVTHKIRSLTKDPLDRPGFVTYGTTTGKNDDEIVLYEDVIGQYKFRLPLVGRFFHFLKSTPGYITLVLVPFVLLLIFQGIGCVKAYRQYRAEEMEGFVKERDRIQEEIEASQRKLMELQEKLKEEQPEQILEQDNLVDSDE